MARLAIGLIALSGLAASLISVQPAVADEATLAAGAGFRRPIAEVATAFEKASGHKILQTYGHLGQVIAQAKESGKIALVCGDRAVLQKAEGINFSSMAPLGVGKLVLAFRKGVTLAQPEDITKDDIKRIGIPDQANAIYGKAGRLFLERAGLAAKIDPKLVAVGTVPQVTSYIVSGEVDAGFINATDAIGAGDKIGGFIEIDQKYYDRVEVSCGIMDASKDSVAAKEFARFLETDLARAILKRYGL